MHFWVITSSCKAGKNENSSNLGVLFCSFVVALINSWYILAFLISAYHFLGLILLPWGSLWLSLISVWAEQGLLFLATVFSGKKKQNKTLKLLWNATNFLTLSHDSTNCHSMPLWKNAVEFNVSVFSPSLFHQKHLLRVISVLLTFHKILFPLLLNSIGLFHKGTKERMEDKRISALWCKWKMYSVFAFSYSRNATTCFHTARLLHFWRLL